MRCRVLGCMGGVLAKDLCGHHYTQMREKGNLLNAILENNSTCCRCGGRYPAMPIQYWTVLISPDRGAQIVCHPCEISPADAESELRLGLWVAYVEAHGVSFRDYLADVSSLE